MHERIISVPARVVLSTGGSFGDLFPTLGLAIGLKQRGFNPVVATSEHYRAIVEGDGLAFHPVRPDLNPFDPDLLTRVMDPRKGSEVIVRDIVVPAIRESFQDLMAVIEGADLVLSHPITFAAPLAAERQRVPWMSTVLAPLSFFSVHDFPALPPFTGVARLTSLSPWIARVFLRLSKAATNRWTAPVDAFRRELGLPAVGSPLFEGQFSPLGTLGLFSNVLATTQPDWPPHTTVTGFVFYDGHGEMPPALARFLDDGDPPIVFTLGSTAVGAGAQAFYADSIAAARALGRRAVLLVGRREAGRSVTGLPAGMMAADYAPHHLLFPRAALIVHHGGVGTTGQALRAGRPALVVPHAHDQPDNGLRVARLGAGHVLDARRYTAARAAAALRALLEEPAMPRRRLTWAAVSAPRTASARRARSSPPSSVANLGR